MEEGRERGVSRGELSVVWGWKEGLEAVDW